MREMREPWYGFSKEDFDRIAVAAAYYLKLHPRDEDGDPDNQNAEIAEAFLRLKFLRDHPSVTHKELEALRIAVEALGKTSLS